MYDAYFGFGKRPFAAVPQVDHYFPAAAIEAARQTLVRCLQRGEGVGAVLGPSGTGKTLLCHILAEHLKGSFRVAMLSAGSLGTRRSLYQAILYQLGRPYRRMDEGELRLALCDYLDAAENCPQGMVLLVDEAHTLPLRLLEELRMLTNLVGNGQPRVRLLLAGGCVLEERLASPRLESFAQRLVARCYLEPLSRVETQTYIHVQIDSAGGRGEAVFSHDTCRSVYQATDGVPRLINQVCDHALLLAYARGRHQIEPADIDEAWADLQQLPAPWTRESAGLRRSGDVIEFGRLDDSPSDSEPGAAVVPGASTLRISPETEQYAGLGTSAADRADRIGAMLDEAEGDFQPAGSIAPEVELVFDDPEKLLRSPFEEEEVVSDRYAPPAEPDGASQEAGPPTRPEETTTVAEPADPDLLVVEDASEDEEQTVTCPIAAVRRQEYAQLFARLRRRERAG